MSEIRINIVDKNQTISGDLHGSLGDVLVASLTAEPETVEELETAVERFFVKDSDWSFFRSFRKGENFEPWDAGLLVIDLAAKVILADSTYSYYSNEGKVRLKTDTGEDFSLPYQLTDDWKYVRSIPEYEGISQRRRKEFAQNPAFEARKILFGKPLCSFIVAECSANCDSTDENLFTEIHAKWLMTERDDLRGKTPREILLEKHDFIDSDLHSRSLQWTVTKECPPPLSADSKAFWFAGFGTNEIVVYYDFFRFLLGECFARNITELESLEPLAIEWLNDPQPEFSGRIPAKIIETERKRVNLTVSAHECLIDEDCDVCQMMAMDFDTPMFWHLDGSAMEYDRFEFSFYETRAEWEEEQRSYEEFNRKYAEKHNNDLKTDGDLFEKNSELI